MAEPQSHSVDLHRTDSGWRCASRESGRLIAAYAETAPQALENYLREVRQMREIDADPQHAQHYP